MAIAVDAVTSGGVNDGTSGDTISHTCTGSNLLLAACINPRDVTAGDTVVSSVTYAGSGTGWSEYVRSEAIISATTIAPAIWDKVAPATGANNLVVTMAATCDRLAVGVISFTGVHQTTHRNISGFGSSTSSGVDVSVAVTTTVDGCYVIDSYYDTTNNAAVSIGAGQTQIFKEAVNAGGDSAGGSYESAPTAGVITMSWTNDTSGAGWSSVVAAYAPAADVAATRRYSLPLIGVG